MADVLIVEDEESLLQTLRYNLARAGHTVACARMASSGSKRSEKTRRTYCCWT